MLFENLQHPPPVSYGKNTGSCGISGQIMKFGRIQSSVAAPGATGRQIPTEEQIECQKAKRCK
jgi:hypothetical protein